MHNSGLVICGGATRIFVFGVYDILMSVDRKPGILMLVLVFLGALELAICV